MPSLVKFRSSMAASTWAHACHQLQLVPPLLGVVHAHALHAAVGRCGRPEEVVQRVGHLQSRAGATITESAAALSLESAAGIPTSPHLP